MVSNPGNRWAVAGATFVVWGLVAASAVYWGMKLSSAGSSAPVAPIAIEPVPAQIGGVARSADPCLLRYRRRAPGAAPT